jgi:hypothetical protein
MFYYLDYCIAATVLISLLTSKSETRAIIFTISIQCKVFKKKQLFVLKIIE